MGFIQDQRMGSHEVDFGEGKVTVYFRKMSLFEMDLIEKAREKGTVDSIVQTVMIRARTDAGVLMFAEADRSKVIRQFNPDAVLELVKAINSFDVDGKSGN